MNFWDTIRGTRLADTIIRCLPKIAEEKKQYTKQLRPSQRSFLDDIESAINKEIKEGSRFVNSVSTEHGVVLVFEK